MSVKAFLCGAKGIPSKNCKQHLSPAQLEERTQHSRMARFAKKRGYYKSTSGVKGSELEESGNGTVTSG